LEARLVGRKTHLSTLIGWNFGLRHASSHGFLVLKICPSIQALSVDKTATPKHQPSQASFQLISNLQCPFLRRNIFQVQRRISSRRYLINQVTIKILLFANLIPPPLNISSWHECKSSLTPTMPRTLYLLHKPRS
jgi:hypothetical protein